VDLGSFSNYEFVSWVMSNRKKARDNIQHNSQVA